MAVTSLKPEFNLKTKFTKIGSGFTKAAKNLGGATTVLLKKTKVKRESIARDKILFNKRDENIKRKNNEEMLEASSVKRGVDRTGSIIANSGRGFLGRIMDTLSSFVAGWLVYNLPTIVNMASDLIGRLQRAGSIIGNFIKDIGNIFTGSAKLLGSVLTNLVTLDIFDTNNRVKNSFTELYNTFGDMQNEIKKGIELVTTPLGQLPGEAGGQFGTSYTTEPGGPSTTSGYGSKEQQALLKTLRFAEGTSKSYGTIFGGNVVPELAEGKLTVQETINMADTGLLPKRLGGGRISGYGSGSKATGAYQFMPGTLEGLIRNGVLKPNELFTPETQDRSALALAAARGVTDTVLKREGFSAGVSAKLAPEWASVPNLTGRSQYNQPVKSLSSLQKVYGQGMSSMVQPRQTISPGVTTTVIDEANVAANKNPIVGKSGGSGEYLTRGGRHKGIDIGTSGQRGYYVALKQTGKVTYARSGYNGGFGGLVIVQNGNMEFYFAHLARIMVKEGQPYNGQTIGEIGNTGRSSGIHLHFEVRVGGKNIDPNPYLSLLSIGRNLKGVAGQVIGTLVSPETINRDLSPAQISTTPNARNVSSQLRSSNRSPQVIVVDDRAPQTAVSSAPSDTSSPYLNFVMDEGKVLNNLIKNHILLDLTYT